MSLQAALLRGVNLGSRKVIMTELRAVCEGAGFTDVKTLLASGNVVLNAKLKGEALERKLEAEILKGLGLKTEVFVRSHAELEAIIAANPFKAFAKKDPSHFVVFFMRAALSAAEKAAIEANQGPEELKPGKGCLYVTFPAGQARTKIKLPKLGTARNWNTVTKLAALTAGE
ncbi:MAG TPA: DUF1697 domain-containing protein [Caulobacterales bacterium]|nr:DUF1697 domain-containing protein [Caulobacterales bacterium]